MILSFRAYFKAWNVIWERGRAEAGTEFAGSQVNPTRLAVNSAVKWCYLASEQSTTVRQ